MVLRVTPRPGRGRPRVGVAIPCYRYGQYLPDCVQSVLGQEGVEVDVLIVDDASPDGSGAVAEKLASSDPRVRAVARGQNLGHIATFNEAVSGVDGEFVVLLSADDLLTPGSLARSAALLREYPDVGMVHGFARTFSDVPPGPRTSLRSWTLWPGPEWLARISRGGGNPVATPEVMLRMSTMRALGGYDPRVPHACDFLMWLRAARIGDIGRLNGVDQGYYRVHGQNMHTEQYGGALTDIGQRHRAFEIFFAEDGRGLPDAAVMRAAARRALAREALLAARSCYEREPVQPDGGAQLVALALDLDPAARDGRLMDVIRRLAEEVDTGGAAATPGAVAALSRKVRHHLRWRHWRRYGVESPVIPR